MEGDDHLRHEQSSASKNRPFLSLWLAAGVIAGSEGAALARSLPFSSAPGWFFARNGGGKVTIGPFCAIRTGPERFFLASSGSPVGCVLPVSNGTTAPRAVAPLLGRGHAA